MSLLSNPIVLRMAVVLVSGGFAFVLGTVLIRRMRRSLVIEAPPPPAATSAEKFPLYSVIQELKQQKHELQSIQQVERRRAKTWENISAAVLSHLSSGVLFVMPNYAVRQANTAARQILGYASPVGMSVSDIFRDSVVIPTFDSCLAVAKVVESALQEKTEYRRLEARYLTPGGVERILELTITSVRAPSGEILGAALLINDQTELTRIRRHQQLRGELSAEMGLELRNSLATISDCARRFAVEPDPEQAQKLAADIAEQADELQRSIGGFLSGASAAGAAAGA